MLSIISKAMGRSQSQLPFLIFPSPPSSSLPSLQPTTFSSLHPSPRPPLLCLLFFSCYLFASCTPSANCPSFCRCPLTFLESSPYLGLGRGHSFKLFLKPPTYLPTHTHSGPYSPHQPARCTSSCSLTRLSESAAFNPLFPRVPFFFFPSLIPTVEPSSPEGFTTTEFTDQNRPQSPHELPLWTGAARDSGIKIG